MFKRCKFHGLRCTKSASFGIVNEQLLKQLEKYVTNSNALVKYHDEIIASGLAIDKIDDKLAELLVKASGGSTQILSQLSGFSDDVLIAFKADISTNSAIFNKFFEKPDLVESWKVLQNAPDAVRRNTSVLDEVAKLRTKTLANGDALDVQKLFDNGFGNTLNSLSDADKTTMLARLNEWDAGKVDDLARRLGKTTDYPNLADDLVDPEMFKLYDDIVHNPELAHELVQGISDVNINRVAKSSFFQKHIKLGKELETRVKKLIDFEDDYLDDLASFYGLSRSQLDDFTTLHQVQINLPNGKYMIADNAFVKQIGPNKFEVYINEVKLSSSTVPTTNQNALKNSLNSGNSTFSNRSTAFGDVLPKDAELVVKKVSKTHCDGTSTGALTITNL